MWRFTTVCSLCQCKPLARTVLAVCCQAGQTPQIRVSPSLYSIRMWPGQLGHHLRAERVAALSMDCFLPAAWPAPPALRAWRAGADVRPASPSSFSSPDSAPAAATRSRAFRSRPPRRALEAAATGERTPAVVCKEAALRDTCTCHWQQRTHCSAIACCECLSAAHL